MGRKRTGAYKIEKRRKELSKKKKKEEKRARRLSEKAEEPEPTGSSGLELPEGLGLGSEEP